MYIRLESQSGNKVPSVCSKHLDMSTCSVKKILGRTCTDNHAFISSISRNIWVFNPINYNHYFSLEMTGRQQTPCTDSPQHTVTWFQVDPPPLFFLTCSQIPTAGAYWTGEKQNESRPHIQIRAKEAETSWDCTINKRKHGQGPVLGASLSGSASGFWIQTETRVFLQRTG